ncbi:sugar porter family MFS transporter [Asaia bogorensis]|uniref:D-xylose transporter XylE n=1 Tax=Asaia bogorensis NBRC 16594 TaxID=1231624 RepID=A0AAN4R3X6_9PROT|nr:sugar porter family MFS transporter [Asaia bogorensis]BAT20006.1 major facilitator superfamily sugar transporter [Asaia bogorensis NBRC 16594]GBQ80792.1 sugar transporter [Asaia bogorensis NBRC 16594]GEL52576.1 D-xylose transporter XylE [Asaia bogorensis NBRC 16594]
MRRIQSLVGVTSERHDVSYVLRICAVAALGGILFGYDTSVISGAIGPIRAHFHLSDAATGWAVSSVILGCIIGAFGSGWLAHTLGRRMALFICAILFSVQSVGAALAPDFTQFIIYRILGGLAVGIASAVSPMYMSEVSPKDMRGRALSMEQFAIVLGALIVYVVNYLIAARASTAWLEEMGWRWMLGSEIVPCLVFCATIFLIPESPRWHMIRGRESHALKTLSRISNEAHARSLIAEIRESMTRHTRQGPALMTVLRDRRARWIVFAGAMVAGLQQFTGINIVVYYAPMLLSTTSGSLQNALFQTIWIGVANLVGGMIGAWIVDRKGRRPLILWGSLGMTIGLLVSSVALYRQDSGLLALFGLLFYMAMFGLSWGPVAWILVSEIFPNRIRSIGMSLAVASNWVMNFVVAQGFPMLAGNHALNEAFHGAFSMWLFATLCLGSMVFVLRYIPETRGVSLEKIEETMMAGPAYRASRPENNPLSTRRPVDHT